MSFPFVALLVAGAASLASAQTNGPEWASRLVRDVTAASFPELLNKDIRVKQFASSSDFFQARFSIRHPAFSCRTQDAILDPREFGGRARERD